MRFVALVGVLVVAATGCTLELQVTKQVTNGTSTGPFNMTSNCGGTPQTLTFNGPGTQNVDFTSSPVASTTCTLTEPGSAGATTTTFACVSPPMGVTCTPIAGGIQVVVAATENTVSVPITVTNDFTPTTLPAAVPDPPTGVTAQLVFGSIIVSWTPPASSGTSPITGYVVTEHPGGATFSTAATRLAINCPAPGTDTFSVQAVNTSGASAPSVSSNAVTVTVTPASCTGLTVRPLFTG